MFYRIAVILFSAASIARSQTYEIKLGGRDSVGERYGISSNAVVEQHGKLESGGQALKNLDQQFTVDLAGVLEVLEIDKGNDATKIKVTASKAMKTENGATTELVPAGTRDQKKIGDSWPVNAVLGAEDLKKHQVIVDPKKFHGESTLAGVEK